MEIVKKLNVCSNSTWSPGTRFSKSAMYLMLAVAPAAAMLFPQTSHAATDTWTGAGSNALWSNAANWGGIPISPLDSLIFAGTTGITPSNDSSVGTTFGSITFDATAGNFTLGGNGIILGTSPFNGGLPIDPTNYTLNLSNYNSLVNNASGLQTINIPLTLSTLSTTASTGGFHIINGGAGGIAINGPFTRTLGSTADFSGNVAFSNTSLTNDSTGIIGGWATYNNTDLATVVAGQVTAYTAYTQVTGAAVIPNTPGANVKWSGSSGAATLASAGTTDINSLVYSDAIASTINMTAGQILRLGAVGTIFRSDSTTNLTNGLLIGTTAGVGTLTAGGAPNTPGEIIFNVNGSFGAPTTAQNTDDVMVNAVIADNGTGKVTVVKTGLGALKFGANNTFTGDIYVDEGRLRNSTSTGWTTGGGNVYVANGAQAYIQVAATVNSNIWLAGIGVEEGNPSPFVGGAMRLAVNGTIYNGNITLTDNARLTARGATGSGATVNGQISGNYQLELGGAATGVLILTNPNNNYTGGTMISSGTVLLGADNVIPNGAGKGNLIMNGDATQGAVTIFNLNGHNQTVNGLASGSTNSTANITNTVVGSSILTVGNNNATATYSGTLTDGGATKSLGITKIGSGTQTLAGSNTYVGPTTISAGTLAITQTAAVSSSALITVAAGATFDTASVGTYVVSNTQNLVNNGGTITSNVSVQGTGSVSGSLFGNNVTIDGGNVAPGATGALGILGTTTFSGLNVNSGQEVVDAFGASDKLVVTGALNLNGNLNITVNPNAVPGTYNILQYGSLTGGGNFTLPITNSGGITYSLNLNTTTKILQLTVAGALQTLTWSNAGGTGDGSSWDIQSNQNWLNGSTHSTYIDGSNVIFNDSNNGHYNVSVLQQVSPNSIVVNNSAGDYTITGAPISGVASITKSGTSALTLGSANSFSGGIVINAGTLNLTASGSGGTGPFTLNGGAVNLGAVGAIGASSALTINGGTLDNTSGAAMTLTNAPITIGGSFTFNGSQALDLGTGSVTLASNTTITVNGSATTGLQIDGTISGGANGIIKNGPGALTLFNTAASGNLFSGGVDIHQGAVLGEIAGAFGNGTVTVEPAGILVLGDTFSNSVVLSGGTVGGDDTDGLSGNVTAAAGTTTTILAGNPLALTSVENMSWTGTLNGSGNLILMNVAGNGSSTGYTSPDASQALRINTTNASTFSGNITVTNNTKAELFATVAGNNNPVGTGTIFMQAGDVALNGTNLTLTANDGYSELNLRNNTSGNVSFPNNVFVLGSGVTVINTLGTAGNGITASLGNLTIGNGQTLAVYFSSNLDHPAGFASVSLSSSGATFAPQLPGFGNTGAIGSDLILGSISEVTPGSGFSMSGLRKLILVGNNSFTGAIALNSGIIQLGSNGAFPAATHVPLTFGNPSTFTTGTLDLHGFNGVVGGLTDLYGAAANIITNSAPSTTGTLTFSTGASTFGGVIQDGTATGGGITALSVASGSLTLSAANTYSGGTSISGGTLIVANINALGKGGVALHTGGKLKLQAALPSAVTVPSISFDGTPGNWTGALDLTNNKLIVQDSVTHATSLANLQTQSNIVITSTGMPANFAVAVLDNAVLNLTTFGGVTVDANSILVGPELLGDANADGSVDLTDLSTVLNNFGASTLAWTSGNFDGAATIDLTDLSDVLNNFGSSNPNPHGAGPVQATPEPTSLAVLGLGAVALLRRRRSA